MRKKTFTLFIVSVVCLFSLNVYSEENAEETEQDVAEYYEDPPYDEIADIEALNENYEKTPIENLNFDVKTRILTGNSTAGSMISIDTGDSMVVDENGLFQFEIPERFKMVIINSMNSEGAQPNSVSYNLETNTILGEGDETIPPDVKEEVVAENKSKSKEGKIKEEDKKAKTNNSTKKEATTQTTVKETTSSKSKETPIRNSSEKPSTIGTKKKIIKSKAKIVISILLLLSSIIGILMYLRHNKKKKIVALKRKKKRKKPRKKTNKSKKVD